VNVSVNLLREERITLGRMACQRDMSISHLIRDCIHSSLRADDPKTAQALRRARVARHERQLENQLSLGLEAA
jgi:hypothetical protein